LFGYFQRILIVFFLGGVITFGKTHAFSVDDVYGGYDFHYIFDLQIIVLLGFALGIAVEILLFFPLKKQKIAT